MTPNGEDFAVDSSAAVAAIDEAHEAHEVASAKVRQLRPMLAGHATFETYSVLTRLPRTRRLSGREADAVISTNFGGSCWINTESQTEFVSRVARLGILGGTIYDALVAQAALDNDRTLLTFDRRAQRTYDAVGVRYELLT